MEQKITETLVHEIEEAGDIADFLESNHSELIAGTLKDYMNALLQRQSLKIVDVIKGSNLNRVYVYQIFSGSKFPSRDKVIALAFGFRLELGGFQRFLKHAGYRELYARDRRDATIIFAVNKGMDLLKTNELLFSLSEPVIE